MDPELLLERLTSAHLEPLGLVLLKEPLPAVLAAKLASILSQLPSPPTLPQLAPSTAASPDLPTTTSLLALDLSAGLDHPVADTLLARLRSCGQPLNCLASVADALFSSLAPSFQLMDLGLFTCSRIRNFFLLLAAAGAELEPFLTTLAERCNENAESATVFLNLVNWLGFQLALPENLSRLPPEFQTTSLVPYLSSTWAAVPRLLVLTAMHLQQWQPVPKHLLALVRLSVSEAAQSHFIGLAASPAVPASQPLPQPDLLDLMHVDVATAAELIASDPSNHDHWATYLAELGRWLPLEDPAGRDRFLELLYRLKGHGISLLSPLPPDFLLYYQALPNAALQLRLYNLPSAAGLARPFSSAEFRLLVQQYLDSPLPDCGGLTTFLFFFGCLSDVPAVFETTKSLLQDLRPLTAHLGGLLAAVLPADRDSVRRALLLLLATAADLAVVLSDALVSEFEPAAPVASHSLLVCSLLAQHRPALLLASRTFPARLWFLSQGPAPLPDHWRRFLPQEATWPEFSLLVAWTLEPGADWSCWLLLAHPLASDPTQLVHSLLAELFQRSCAPAWLPAFLHRLATSLSPLNITALLPAAEQALPALLDALLYLPLTFEPSALPSLPRASEGLAAAALLLAAHAALPPPALSALLSSYPFSVHCLTTLARRTANPELVSLLEAELAQRRLPPLTPPLVAQSLTETEFLESAFLESAPSLLPSFAPLGLPLTLPGSALALRLKLASPTQPSPAARQLPARSRPTPTTPAPTPESRKRFGTPLAIDEIVKKLKITNLPVPANQDNNDVVLL